MSQAQQPVLLTIKDGIAEIRFNRPDRLNALNIHIAAGFSSAVDEVLGDPSVRVIVIAAQGRAFMAGGDLAHFRESADKRAASAELIGPVHAALKKLAEAPQIVIGSVQGALAGAGMSLALGLDMLIAADDTTFNFAYARVATSPDCGGSWALPRLVGLRKALEIALLSETIGAEQALQAGLVNRLVPRAQLEAETGRLARRMASGAFHAQGRIKNLVRGSFDRTYAEQLDKEAASFADCSTTPDFAEALEAFFGKRAPQFTQDR